MRLRQTTLLTQLVDLQQVDKAVQVLLDLGQTVRLLRFSSSSSSVSSGSGSGSGFFGQGQA